MLPSSLWSLFTTRLGLLILRAVLREVFTGANRPPSIMDESVDSFFTRRFGADFARVLGSALVHGIYAADSRQLSVRAAFPSMWEAEERGAGSVIMGELGPRAWISASRRSREAKARAEAEAWELGKDAAFEKQLKGAALISFKDGMESLIDGLLASLRRLPNVSLNHHCNISSLARDGSIFKVCVMSRSLSTSLNGLSAANRRRSLPAYPCHICASFAHIADYPCTGPAAPTPHC